MKARHLLFSTLILGLLAIGFIGCSDDNNDDMTPAETALDPNTAPRASVDRFSAAAGHLMVRDASNGLPAANAPINYDQAPFITRGFGPNGENTRYYNFDVQMMASAPIYVLKRMGENTPVDGQLNIINVKPGDAGYTDFWRVNFVTVPANYVANTIHSEQQILDGGYAIEVTTMAVNCPVVPEGSTATLRIGAGNAGLARGWYKNEVVFYFSFEERALSVSAAGEVALSPIFVCFNINPNEPGGGPASGFVTEPGSDQTHNVLATLPSNPLYSPLWEVSAYSNSSFGMVMNLGQAQSAPSVGMALATVNCPVVSVQ